MAGLEITFLVSVSQDNLGVIAGGAFFPAEFIFLTSIKDRKIILKEGATFWMGVDRSNTCLFLLDGNDIPIIVDKDFIDCVQESTTGRVFYFTKKETDDKNPA